MDIQQILTNRGVYPALQVHAGIAAMEPQAGSCPPDPVEAGAMAEVIAIRVAPTDCGWVVSAPALCEDLFLLSGRCAEAVGRRLAQRLADAHHAVELEIVLRNGLVAGRIRYPDQLVG